MGYLAAFLRHIDRVDETEGEREREQERSEEIERTRVSQTTANIGTRKERYICVLYVKLYVSVWSRMYVMYMYTYECVYLM